MFDDILISLSSPTETLTWPKFNNLNLRLEKNINSLIDFKISQNRWLPSTMPLYTLVDLLPKSNKSADYEKLDRVYNEGLMLANRVGMTTIFNETYPIKNGLFLGKCKEQWVAIMENKETTNVIKDLKPIRCLWHPFTSLNFWMEEGVSIFNKNVAFFIVDIMSLSRMINNHLRNLGTQDRFNIRFFIAKSLIPTLIDDIISITMFNRINNLFMTEKNENDPSRIIPVWLDLIDEVNQNQTDCIDLLLRSTGGLDFLSANIPLVGDQRLLDFLNSLPSTPPVKNIFPLMFSAVSPYLNFLLSFNKTINGVKNRTLTNHLKIQLNIMKNDKTLLSNDNDLKNQQMFNFEFMRSLFV